MWRQMLVDPAYVERIRRALLSALLRANLGTLVVILAMAAGTSAMALSGGDWTFVAVAGLLLVSLPVFLWRAAARGAARTPVGSYVAFAVTPDGTLHSSGIAGTTTVNPGYVARVGVAGDCWLIGLSTGQLVVVPRELIPDADARLLVRHLPNAKLTP